MTNVIESSETSAEATQAETETAPEGRGLENLAEMLAADLAPEGAATGEDNPEASDAARNGEDKATPTRFNDLAEATGLSLDALYAIEVSTNDGETVSVQDLKNAYGKQNELTLRELEFEERRAADEGKLRQAQNELAEIVAGLPENAIKPQVLESIRARHAQTVERERAATLETIPSWQDEQTRESELQGMAEHLESFGLPRTYLAQVIDHRQMNFIRESWLRERRIKSALEKVRAGAPNPTTTSKPTGKAPRRSPAVASNSKARNKLEALFSNLE